MRLLLEETLTACSKEVQAICKMLEILPSHTLQHFFVKGTVTCHSFYAKHS